MLCFNGRTSVAKPPSFEVSRWAIADPIDECNGLLRSMEEIQLTTKHVWHLLNNGISTISTGAEFLPSTVGKHTLYSLTKELIFKNIIVGVVIARQQYKYWESFCLFVALPCSWASSVHTYPFTTPLRVFAKFRRRSPQKLFAGSLLETPSNRSSGDSFTKNFWSNEFITKATSRSSTYGM